MGNWGGGGGEWEGRTSSCIPLLTKARRGTLLRSAALLIIVLLALVSAGVAHAQNRNQFGAQERADAAHELIVLAVERGIASLPPTTGQAVTYEFDPASDALHRSLRLGPTVLRSAQTIGRGTFSVRVAASYFDANQSLGPINYLFDDANPAHEQSVTKLGLDADAHVGLLNLSASYGVTNRLELLGNVPLTVVDARASASFTTATSELGQPPSQALVHAWRVHNGDVAGAIGGLDDQFRSGTFSIRRDSFSSLGYNFNDGTHAGVGRISLGGKFTALTTERIQLAMMSEIFLPSPSQAEFAGSDSVAVLPRLIGTAKLTDALRLYTDAGYEYDFDEASLRRFTWTAGGSLGFQRFSVDFGVGGSQYEEPITWTPSTVYGAATSTFPASTGHALQDNATGTTVVNLLLGIKLRISEDMVIAGGVTVPVVNTDFQPDVLGTIALECYF